MFDQMKHKSEPPIPTPLPVRESKEDDASWVEIGIISLTILFLVSLFYIAGNSFYKMYHRHSYMESLGCQKVEYYNDVPPDWKDAIHGYRCPPNVDVAKASYGRPE